MGLFGPSKSEVWQQFSKEIGADIYEGMFDKTKKVVKMYNNWTIYLDTYSSSTGQSTITYTRIRAPFVKYKNFYFKIKNKGIFSGLKKIFGIQDIKIGYDEIDNNYSIQCNDHDIVLRLFSNLKIRKLINLLPKICLEIKKNEGIFGPKFQENESELYFIQTGVIKDINTLKILFELFSKILKELDLIGCISIESTKIQLY
jgi:hypothetical protein